MYGAILGDIIGQPYEFDIEIKSKKFPLFRKSSHFTDDTVMTIAVCEGILNAGLSAGEEEMKASIVKSMEIWGKKYPFAGYGGMFGRWIMQENKEPYKSYGNGSAMRVSSVGWLFDTLERTREVARWSSEVTHNHIEGIKGAESTASVIFLARTGKSKEEIKAFIQKEFGYDLSRTCDQIRPLYLFDSSCQGTCPEAITCFIEGTDFEDVIRNAVSLGGDSDTLAAIAGSMAEAFFEIPEGLKKEALKRTKKDMHEVIERFEKVLGRG